MNFKVVPDKLIFINHNNTYFGHNNNIICFKCENNSQRIKLFLEENRFQLWYTKVNPVNFKIHKIEKLEQPRNMELVFLDKPDIHEILQHNLKLRLIDHVDYKNDIEEYVLYSKLGIYSE
jgi:hypothetical protein